ncbi:MAG TPA: molybdenum cofactor guanylyltransferase MobA [Dongiaceae bacterium]|nr:molybdenum cofactor guanylyltransferase MobA [Dongiaceae bacterium]
MSNIKDLNSISGVILAGGQARRLGGGDKGLRELAGRPLLLHVIARLRPQVAGLVLNANGDPARFGSFNLPVVGDSVAGQPGPLAGILSGLDWAAAQSPAPSWVVTAPADCPFLPRDLVARLAAGVTAGATAVVASYQGRLQPVIGLWSTSLREDLRRALLADGLRRVEDWLHRCNAIAIEFPLAAPDPFFNVNTAEDLARAADLLTAG